MGVSILILVEASLQLKETFTGEEPEFKAFQSLF